MTMERPVDRTDARALVWAVSDSDWCRGVGGGRGIGTEGHREQRKDCQFEGSRLLVGNGGLLRWSWPPRPSTVWFPLLY